MSSPIDFSSFSTRLLKSIEATGQFSRRLGRSQIDAACLVAGLCQVDNAAVSSFFQSRGYDFNASMQRLAATFNVRQPVMQGVHFSPEVEKTFAHCASSYRAVDMPQLLEALLKCAPTELVCHLVRLPQAQRQGFPGNMPGAGMPGHQQPAAPPQQAQPSESAAQQPGVQRNPADDDSSTGETVRKYCQNMLQLAASGKYRHAIGRDEELKRVYLILARSSKNNPVLVGEPGTGKTAIAEELALRLYEGKVPEDLAQLKLYSLDFASVKALPDKVDVMKKILEEATGDPRLVLFIDEIHMIISACSCSDNDIANLLKPAMARGEIKVFGATTLDEYKRIEKDPAFERRFQKVVVDEPDIESAIKILQGSKRKFEEHHEVTIPDEVCKAAVTLSARYITNRRLPDKAFDLIDEAAACVRLEEPDRQALSANDIMKVITAWTGIPVDSMDENETRRLQNIEEELKGSVIGQDEAVKVVSEAIKRNRMGFSDPSRPIGSFLFLGTTGTGKTELCKAVAKFLFNDPNMMVRIDMSEYQQEHSAHRLFGAPPGYVGYDEGGQLTEAVYRKPFSVVLFDEIEKAHPKIYETLLQVLDDGRMTDGKGKVVNFKNTIIIMTSNIGQQCILDAMCGREATEAEVEMCTGQVLQQLRSRVAPEFINRIDDIVMFRPLSRESIARIAELNIKKEQKKLKENGIEMTFDPSVLDFIVEHGYQPEYGGRPVKRAITDYILDPLSGELVDGTVTRGSVINVSVQNGKVTFTNASPGM